MNNLLKQLSEKEILLEEVNGELKLFSKTGIVDPETLALIRENKENIIAELRKGNAAVSKEIPLVPKQQSYPLSSAQNSLWITSQFEGASVAYNVSYQLPIQQPLDVASFKKAMHAVIERHEILKTVFKKNEEGEVRQWILDEDALDFVIQYKDYRDVADNAVAVKKFIEEDSGKEFDLEKGPLFNVCLLQLADSAYVFYYNMHHIISDGWSLEVLGRDAMSFYEAFAKNETPTLSPLRIQYKDFASWQTNQVDTDSYNKHKEFWLNQLSGELPFLDLPGKNITSTQKTYNGRLLETVVAKKETLALKHFVAQNGGSLFMAVLAALKVLLYRYTDQKDIIIGTPISGRDNEDLSDQIGFYLNTLALRDTINPTENFISFYNRLQNNMLKAYDHQDYPFYSIVSNLKMKYDQSRSAVFDVSITFHNLSEDMYDSNAEETSQKDETIDYGFEYVKHDIEFHFQPLEDTINFNVVYNTDRYDKELMVDFMQHYKQLLTSLFKNVEKPLSQVSYISEKETHELLHDFNSKKNAASEETLVSLFAKQVNLTPNVPAVFFNEVSLTYKELDEVSNQLAHCFIKEHAIKPHDLIAVKLDRSEKFIITILAILKVGAAYIPIDTNYPQERKEYILNDANVKLLVTDSNYIFDLEYYEGNLFAIDIDFEAAEYDETQPTVDVKTADLAYIIYTSGSTGMPKGVMIQHKGIVNTMLAQIDLFIINPEENKHSLQFASYAFDASVSEIFITLLSGSTLYMVDENTRKTPALLEQYIIDNKIDVATIPPSYLKLLNVESLKNMNVLVTAGEAAVYNKVMEYLEFGGIYYNAFGPTETSICSCVFKMTKETAISGTQIPIGMPIANVQMYVLDAHNNLQPKGVVGELCISGAGLAKGYLNSETLTEEKFIAHPFNKGERLYKTGDMGRMLQDGAIEFVGRVDDQVKIRGHRIELGEVAYQLESKEDIEEVALLVKDNETGDKELVAYIVSEKEQNASEIRQFLSDRLPDYMLPNAYIQVAKIPLNTSGKVAHDTLLSMQGKNIDSGTEYVAPRNETEQKIHDIWSSILNIEKISVIDDFFVLGGQSILGIKLISRIHKELGILIELKDIFSERTIASIAEYVETSQQLDAQENIEETENKLIF
ncbi:Tyrocidine synthase 3 [Kordia antarctica]|uniref:Tyrocidine synthase 3 n=1 Tax=Kordia antarctica TaxID=1218801 RepID=A0A7L4ZFE9_9FLAO|nr:non-ribosomal peptide synthetase [Kordia antarctica]QHI35402.1 Tyrocidine synthase 3 [Kordia antarctica]